MKDYHLETVYNINQTVRLKECKVIEFLDYEVYMWLLCTAPATNFEKRFLSSVFPYTEAVDPVSYTHLDVYKRQVCYI